MPNSSLLKQAAALTGRGDGTVQGEVSSPFPPSGSTTGGKEGERGTTDGPSGSKLDFLRLKSRSLMGGKPKAKEEEKKGISSLTQSLLGRAPDADQTATQGEGGGGGLSRLRKSPLKSPLSVLCSQEPQWQIAESSADSFCAMVSWKVPALCTPHVRGATACRLSHFEVVCTDVKTRQSGTLRFGADTKVQIEVPRNRPQEKGGKGKGAVLQHEGARFRFSAVNPESLPAKGLGADSTATYCCKVKALRPGRSYTVQVIAFDKSGKQFFSMPSGPLSHKSHTLRPPRTRTPAASTGWRSPRARTDRSLPSQTEVASAWRDREREGRGMKVKGPAGRGADRVTPAASRSPSRAVSERLRGPSRHSPAPFRKGKAKGKGNASSPPSLAQPDPFSASVSRASSPSPSPRQQQQQRSSPPSRGIWGNSRKKMDAAKAQGRATDRESTRGGSDGEGQKKQKRKNKQKKVAVPPPPSLLGVHEGDLLLEVPLSHLIPSLRTERGEQPAPSLPPPRRALPSSDEEREKEKRDLMGGMLPAGWARKSVVPKTFKPPPRGGPATASLSKTNAATANAASSSDPAAPVPWARKSVVFRPGGQAGLGGRKKLNDLQAEVRVWDLQSRTASVRSGLECMEGVDGTTVVALEGLEKGGRFAFAVRVGRRKGGEGGLVGWSWSKWSASTSAIEVPRSVVPVPHSV
eukprot:Cvel_22983.t1-p1 / transcript=Cvel_22983.t1 / gene=Cvel_22983 / organism=Chromera_velia_CCMP2878 / gene_product=hypothetical protein / transcript_product=hypothetical protein / location=Cvel_scaffold2317:28924-31217(+) / protein_length=690 / sequence_SO=supercontig / SO=protein_coding / is_pseudo=false